MATLNKFSADTIVEAIQKNIGEKKFTLLTSGGGMHNPLLMQHIKKALPQCNITDTNQLQIHPDAKEAILFAILANECVAGEENYFSGKGRGIPGVSMGKISFPC
jgi:anhydro-N-acetylmuramic acid kinase